MHSPVPYSVTEQKGIEPFVRPPGPALGGGGTPTPLCMHQGVSLAFTPLGRSQRCGVTASLCCSFILSAYFLCCFQGMDCSTRKPDVNAIVLAACAAAVEAPGRCWASLSTRRLPLAFHCSNHASVTSVVAIFLFLGSGQLRLRRGRAICACSTLRKE